MSSTRLRALLVVLCVLFAVSIVYAAPPGICSATTLNGSYGFFGEGVLVGDPAMRLVITGIISYDGNGNLVGESISNVEGWGAGTPGTFSGTYTVNPDCTYSGEHTGDGETIHFTGTITGSGMLQELHFVVTDPGFVALGTDRPVPAAGCSPATLKGSYALFGGGTITALTPPAPITHVGTVTYDGAGNFFGSDTITLNGATIADTFTGTYTVTQSCAIAVEITSTAVGLVHEEGRIVGEGKSQEVRLIVTDPGFLFQEATRKQ